MKKYILLLFVCCWSIISCANQSSNKKNTFSLNIEEVDLEAGVKKLIISPSNLESRHVVLYKIANGEKSIEWFGCQGFSVYPIEENAEVKVTDGIYTIYSLLTDGWFILNYQMDENNEIVLKVQKNGYEFVETSFLFDPINVLYIKLINTQQLLLLAEECMANLEFSEAEILLKRALCLTPDRDDIKYLLCISLYKQDKKDEALKNIEKLNKKVIPNSYIEGLKNKITNEEAAVNK